MNSTDLYALTEGYRSPWREWLPGGRNPWYGAASASRLVGHGIGAQALLAPVKPLVRHGEDEYTFAHMLNAHVAFYRATFVRQDGARVSHWGYGVGCAHCGAWEGQPVGTSVLYEDAPGRFARQHLHR